MIYMLSEMVEWLEYSYTVLNRGLYGESLPDVVITVQSDRKAYAYITMRKVWKSGDEYYYEINLSAEHLDREKINILSSLSHEMAHLYNLEQEIKDTSNRNRYHNNNFKKTAEEKGLLKIDYAPTIGWSVTSPTEAFINVVRESGLLERTDTKIYRTKYGEGDSVAGGDDTTGIGGKDGKRKSSTRNYECACGHKVRATKDMTGKIICADCMSYYIEVRKDG